MMDARGINPNALARATGTKQPQIYRFLTGIAVEPKRSTLEPVAKFFGVDVEAFFHPKVADAAWAAFTNQATSPQVNHDSGAPYIGVTNRFRAPVVEWARLAEDVLKDAADVPGELVEYSPFGLPGARAKFVKIQDESLAPRLSIGDMVAIDPDNRSPERGQVTLFRSSVDGQYFLRRYQPLLAPHFEAVDAKGLVLDSQRHGLEIVGVRCGFHLFDW